MSGVLQCNSNTRHGAQQAKAVTGPFQVDQDFLGTRCITELVQYGRTRVASHLPGLQVCPACHPVQVHPCANKLQAGHPE